MNCYALVDANLGDGHVLAIRVFCERPLAIFKSEREFTGEAIRPMPPAEYSWIGCLAQDDAPLGRAEPKELLVCPVARVCRDFLHGLSSNRRGLQRIPLVVVDAAALKRGWRWLGRGGAANQAKSN